MLFYFYSLIVSTRTKAVHMNAEWRHSQSLEREPVYKDRVNGLHRLSTLIPSYGDWRISMSPEPTI